MNSLTLVFVRSSESSTKSMYPFLMIVFKMWTSIVAFGLVFLIVNDMRIVELGFRLPKFIDVTSLPLESRTMIFCTDVVIAAALGALHRYVKAYAETTSTLQINSVKISSLCFPTFPFSLIFKLVTKTYCAECLIYNL